MIDKAIISTLAYFDIFKYPLKSNEIFRFLPAIADDHAVNSRIAYLLESGLINQKGDLYSLNSSDKIYTDRQRDNLAANKSLPIAIKRAASVKTYPFVKDVLISGSLSKGVMKEDSDMDFFIVASRNRIWLCKFFLKCYKFLFLKNSRDEFCMNYFIDEDNLQIDEKNMFTAIELVTLIPVDEFSTKPKIIASNPWIEGILPHAYADEMKIASSSSLHRRSFVEKVLGGKIGDVLNTVVKKGNVIRNKIKYRKLKKSLDYDLMLRSSDSQIKVHNSNHQRVILEKYISKLDKYDLEKKFVKIYA